MKPGEYLLAESPITYNSDRSTLKIDVTNAGDRPIQIGSHYHFFETNTALVFERAQTRGYRLNIPAGTAIRFDPGETRTVELVALPVGSSIYGFNGLIMGPL
jgi:urease subunit beta